MIAHVRHEARLDIRGEDGFTQRQHLAGLAKRGKAEAIKQLKGPPCPESLRYLKQWARELHGRSGVSQVGLNPMSYATIESWMRLTGNIVTPREVGALLTLDAAMLFPGEAE